MGESGFSFYEWNLFWLLRKKNVSTPSDGWLHPPIFGFVYHQRLQKFHSRMTLWNKGIQLLKTIIEPSVYYPPLNPLTGFEVILSTESNKNHSGTRPFMLDWKSTFAPATPSCTWLYLYNLVQLVGDQQRRRRLKLKTILWQVKIATHSHRRPNEYELKCTSIS